MNNGLSIRTINCNTCICYGIPVVFGFCDDIQYLKFTEGKVGLTVFGKLQYTHIQAQTNNLEFLVKGNCMYHQYTRPNVKPPPS